MPSADAKPFRSTCPINIALETLGDGWSLLIVRDLMLKEGRTSYKDFLEAEEGIASNILADRLEKLESAGIISKTQDPNDGRRSRYRLTEAGIDLAPMLIEMILWSAKYFETAAPAAVIEEMTTRKAKFLKEISRQWKSGAD